MSGSYRTVSWHCPERSSCLLEFQEEDQFAGTEERDSEQVAVFSTHFRKQNDSKCDILQHAATLRNIFIEN